MILIWFYLLMPLWIAIVRRAGKLSLILLFVAQLGFDYWSSFSVAFNTFVYALPDHSLLKPFLMYRLNYWVVHYVFIFVLGGYLAVHIQEFQRFMKENRRAITVFFWASLVWLLAYYYQLIFETGYTPLEAINIYIIHIACIDALMLMCLRFASIILPHTARILPSCAKIQKKSFTGLSAIHGHPANFHAP